MSRDYRNLKVFALAANIVEGSVRHSTREWINFLNIAGGSATEAAATLPVLPAGWDVSASQRRSPSSGGDQNSRRVFEP